MHQMKMKNCMGHFPVSPLSSSSSLTPSVKQCVETFDPAFPVYCLHPTLVWVLSLLHCSLLERSFLKHFPQKPSAYFHFSRNRLCVISGLRVFSNRNEMQWLKYMASELSSTTRQQTGYLTSLDLRQSLFSHPQNGRRPEHRRNRVAARIQQSILSKPGRYEACFNTATILFINKYVSLWTPQRTASLEDMGIYLTITSVTHQAHSQRLYVLELIE